MQRLKSEESLLSGRQPLERAASGVVTLEQMRLICDVCRQRISVDGKRLVCLDCSARLRFNTYDLCETCVSVHGEDDPPGTYHRLREGVSEVRVAVYPSLARTMENRYRCFEFFPFLGTRDADDAGWSWTLYGEVYAMARALASHLLEQPAVAASQRQPMVAICGANCVEWVVSETAICFAGAVCAPIHCTGGRAQILAQLLHSHASVLLCDTTVMALVKDHVPEGVHILVWGSPEWLKAIERPQTEWKDIQEPSSDDEPRTLLFTSGSTGRPKAAVLTDRVLKREFTGLTWWRPLVAFCYEPLAYATQRLIYFDVLGNGGRMTFWTGQMDRFFDQLGDTQVSSFSAPPRIWNACYSLWKAKRASDSTEAANQYIRKLFSLCHNASTGGATTSPAVLNWMQECLSKACKILVSEGYGCTEVGSVARNGVRAFNCTIHLEDVPEMGYLTTDTPARGLLWAHTPRSSMAHGYFEDEENTQANFRDIHGDGRIFFCTGDVVEYDKRLERLRVIDRVKNFVKLSNACFVAPDYIENTLIECEMIKQIWVYAESKQQCVLAVVQPNMELLRLRRGEAFSNEALCDSVSKQLIMDEICEVGGRTLQSYEIPADIVLESGEWTQETGELTVSFKLNRTGLTIRYRDQLRALYKDLDTQRLLLSSSGEPGASELALSGSGRNIGIDVTSADETPFEKIIRSVFPRVNFNNTLIQCGGDSTTVMQITQMLKIAGILVPLDMLYSLPLCELRDKLALDADGKGHVANKQAIIDWDKECELPAELVDIIEQQNVEASKSDKHTVDAAATAATCILLTGATGFLGSFLLRDLLARSSSNQRVVCVVRAGDDVQASDRLLKSAALFETGLDAIKAAVTDKQLVAYAGDLSRAEFGWPKPQWERVMGSTSAVVHCACHVTGVLSYSLLRPDNVEATLHCLALAAGARASFVYVSSMSSQGAPHVGLLNSYGATKRVSEILVEKAAALGAGPCSIIRPGMIGMSARGALSPGDTVTRFCRALVQLAIVPDLAQSERISLCSVDDVARATCNLLFCEEKGEQGQRGVHTVNVAGPGWTTFGALSHAAAKHCAKEPEHVPYKDFIRRVQEQTHCALHPLVDYFRSGFPLGLDHGRFDEHEVVTDITDDLIEQSFEWMKRHNLFV